MFMIRKFARWLKNRALNSCGFHSETPIIVIESDDWGSIRMPSQCALKELMQSGDCAADDAFLKYDTLERKEDLEKLFSSLEMITDHKGRHPCITANFAVANPKFEEIKVRDGIYSCEPFWETYDKYYGKDNAVIATEKKGIEKGLFFPQLHAREHLNVQRWMRDLKAGKNDTIRAFELNMIGIGASFSKENMFGYMDALNYDSKNEVEQLADHLNEAFSLFREAFGYLSKTFVASCYVWTDEIEKILAKHNVEGLQTQCWQKEFLGKGTTFEHRIFHYLGERGKYGMIYTIRNCDYEPAIDGFTKETEEKCVQQIEEAFHNRKPAVINTHRVNYVGGIEESHAAAGRDGLINILDKIISMYPNVEFLSTPELICRIKKSHGVN